MRVPLADRDLGCYRHSLPELLVSRLRDAAAKASDAGKELVGALDPDEGVGMLVPGADPVPDVRFEGTLTHVAAATDAGAAQLGKPALHQGQPRPAGGGEMRVKAWVAQQPTLDGGSLVGGVVVED